MKHVHDLKLRLHSLETLSTAVSAMTSLAAHHFRKAREGLGAARAYRDTLEKVLAAIPITPTETGSTKTAVLLIASDLGLCDGYNTQLTHAAIQHAREVGTAEFYCVGHRPASALQHAGVEVARQYRAPSSVAGLTELLLTLAGDLLEDHYAGRFSLLDFVSARFEGVGEFTPTITPVLPVRPAPAVDSLAPSSYVSRRHLIAVAIREYLYIRLYQTLLDALASEHGARLVATQSAGEWLSEKTETARRRINAVQREAATQEVLEIATAVRHAGNRRPE